MSKSKKSKSSQRWLKAHREDPYVKQAKREGLRSRSTYKLTEIQKKDDLMAPGDVVVDIGAAPGGWSEFAASCVKKGGRVIALDLLPITPFVPTKDSCTIECLQGDFNDPATIAALLSQLGDQPADLILSDIAPNSSGIRQVDQLKSMQLAEGVLALSAHILKPEGCFLIKVFQGAGFEAYLHDVRQQFKKIAIRKPSASRPHSREVYIVARGFKGEAIVRPH